MPLAEPEPISERAIFPLVCDSRTILFGRGGAGKGFVSAAIITASLGVQSLPLPMAVLEPVRFGVLDFEDNRTEWADRLARFGAPIASVPYRESKPFGRKSRAAIEARKWADSEGVEIVIYDSIIPAVGGMDVASPESAQLYADALTEIGLPSLSLAHVTKTARGDALDYPYGSVTWHNNARLIWRLEQEESERGTLAVKLTNTKASRWMREPDPLALSVTFDDVTGLNTVGIGSVRDAGYAARKEIVNLLADGVEMTIAEIARATGRGIDAVRKMLVRNPETFIEAEPARGPHPAIWGLK